MSFPLPLLALSLTTAVAHPPDAPAEEVPTEEAHTEEEMPRWLAKIRNPYEEPRISDAYGLRVTRQSRAGLVTMAAGVGMGLTGAYLGVGLRSEPIFVASLLMGGGVTVVGALTSAVALERANIDLRFHGLKRRPSAARLLGHTALTGGVIAMVAGAVLAASVNDDNPLFLAGMGLTLASAIPYGVATRQASTDYLRLESATVSIAPTWDPRHDTVGLGLSGRF